MAPVVNVNNQFVKSVQLKSLTKYYHNWASMRIFSAYIALNRLCSIQNDLDIITIVEMGSDDMKMIA